MTPQEHAQLLRELANRVDDYARELTVYVGRTSGYRTYDIVKRARAAAAEIEGREAANEPPDKEAPIWYNSDMASSWEAGRQDGWADALARFGGGEVAKQ